MERVKTGPPPEERRTEKIGKDGARCCATARFREILLARVGQEVFASRGLVWGARGEGQEKPRAYIWLHLVTLAPLIPVAPVGGQWTDSGLSVFRWLQWLQWLLSPGNDWFGALALAVGQIDPWLPHRSLTLLGASALGIHDGSPPLPCRQCSARTIPSLCSAACPCPGATSPLA